MDRCGCFASIASSLCGNNSKARARYNEQDYTIEFENLIEEDDFYEPSQHALSDVEKDLLKKGKFVELLEHQEKLGEKQEEILRQQEEDARLEDEAYIQAKREAARARKLKQTMDKKTLMKLRMNNTHEFSKWLAEEDIDITSPNLGMEDFDSFLQKMRAKNNTELTLGSDDENEEFERRLKQGVKATKIADDAMNALQPVQLHAVVSNKSDYSSTINYEAPYSRPFTPDFSSINSNASDLSLSTNNTPSKDIDSFDTATRTENSSFNNSSAFSSDIEATPRNDSTFIVGSKDEISINEQTSSTATLITTTSKTIDIKAQINTTNTICSSPSEKVNGSLKNNSLTKPDLTTTQTGLENGGFSHYSTNDDGGNDSYDGFDEDDDFVSADGDDFEEMLV